MVAKYKILIYGSESIILTVSHNYLLWVEAGMPLEDDRKFFKKWLIEKPAASAMFSLPQ